MVFIIWMFSILCHLLIIVVPVIVIIVLKVPSCKSSTFQSSFFNRIVPLWNHTCKIASPGDLRSLATFKSFLSRTYFNLVVLMLTCAVRGLCIVAVHAIY
jgi:hypothetical protein